MPKNRIGLESYHLWQIARFVTSAAREDGWHGRTSYRGLRRDEVIISIKKEYFHREVVQTLVVWTTSPTVHTVAAFVPIQRAEWPDGDFIVPVDVISILPSSRKSKSVGIFLDDEGGQWLAWSSGRKKYRARRVDMELQVPKPFIARARAIVEPSDAMARPMFSLSVIPSLHTSNMTFRNVHVYTEGKRFVMEASDGFCAARAVFPATHAVSFDTTLHRNAFRHAARALWRTHEAGVFGFDAYENPAVAVSDKRHSMVFLVSWRDRGEYLDAADTFDAPEPSISIEIDDLAAWSIAVANSQSKMNVYAVMRVCGEMFEFGVLHGRRPVMVRNIPATFKTAPDAVIAIDAKRLRKVLEALLRAGAHEAELHWRAASHLHLIAKWPGDYPPSHYVFRRVPIPRRFSFA